jgi:hypothetical protein
VSVPRNWSLCTAVRVTETHFQRELSCEHPQPVKPLEYLNETTQRDPQAMVGHSFPCHTCFLAAYEKYGGK